MTKSYSQHQRRRRVAFVTVVMAVTGLAVWFGVTAIPGWITPSNPAAAFVDPKFTVGIELDGSFQQGELITIPPRATFVPSFTSSTLDAGDVIEIRYWLNDVELMPGQPIQLPADAPEPVELRAQARSESLDATFRSRCFLVEADE